MKTSLTSLRAKVGTFVPVLITGIDHNDRSVGGEYFGFFDEAGFIYVDRDLRDGITVGFVPMSDEGGDVWLVDYIEPESPVEMKDGVQICKCTWDQVWARGCKCGAITPYVLTM